MNIAITGASVITAGMHRRREVWQQVCIDELLPALTIEADVVCQLALLSRGETAILSRQQQLGLAAAELAWQEAGLPPERQALRGEQHAPLNQPWRREAGVVSASALGDLSSLLVEQQTPGSRPRPTSLSRWRGNALGAALAVRFGLQGDQFNLNAASSSGAQAIALAARLIEARILQVAVVVGAEPALPSLLLEANRRSGAMAPSGSSQPLRADRSGMVPREAAAALVLEHPEHASSRGATPLAELHGCASGCEAHHLVAPLPAQALSHALLEQLLSEADRKQTPIDWLCLHATGTPRFDQEEIAFVIQAFPTLPWISAFKRSLGHSLGAAGVVEAALIVEGLHRGEVPPWPDAIDPAFGLTQPERSQGMAPQNALQLAAGMGGVVVMNHFKAVPQSQPKG
jgi:3-oxoacyl-[acyl-carrier-protein] synthase II